MATLDWLSFLNCARTFENATISPRPRMTPSFVGDTPYL